MRISPSSVRTLRAIQRVFHAECASTIRPTWRESSSTRGASFVAPEGTIQVSRASRCQVFVLMTWRSVPVTNGENFAKLPDRKTNRQSTSNHLYSHQRLWRKQSVSRRGSLRGRQQPIPLVIADRICADSCQPCQFRRLHDLGERELHKRILRSGMIPESREILDGRRKLSRLTGACKGGVDGRTREARIRAGRSRKTAIKK